MLLFGSAAVRHWYPDVPDRGELDLWASPTEAQVLVERLQQDVDVGRQRVHHLLAPSGRALRLEICPPGSTGARLEADCAAGAEKVDIEGVARARVLTPPFVRAMERATLYYPVKWDAHADSYHALKQRQCQESPEICAHAQASRVAELQQRYQHRFNATTKSLMMKNEEFFGNYPFACLRAFKHDDLHIATAYGETPLYEQLKNDKSLAYIPRGNFNKRAERDQVRVVQEEGYAIALERVVIPSIEFNRPYDAVDAFRFAIRRICTNLTRGWFRDFAIEHQPQAIETAKDYVADFHAAVASGKIMRQRNEPWTPEDEAQVSTYFRTYRDEWQDE